jgi:phage tail sheath protein FI
VEAVNQKTKLIQLIIEQTAEDVDERLPQEGSYVLSAPQKLPDTKIEVNHFIGVAAERSGVEGMELAEDVTMVCCPDLMSAYQAGAITGDGVKAVQAQMIAHCERMGDRMAILDPIPNLTPQQADLWRSRVNYDSKYASLYYPWLTIMGPAGNPIAVPPSGHIAGVFARSDTERGVHKAPANEIVRGAIAVATPITKGEQDVLNPHGVNCIRAFNGRGIRVWGARTLSSDPAWRYVNVRRIFNYVEKSVERGTQWVVFEPNDADLWARVRRDVTAFLTGVWRDGMLFGGSPAEAFYVKCDEELNPPDVRDRGQLIMEIGLAPVKPAEFVVFRISQWAGGGA